MGDTITVALGGDVMLGRGIDQVLPHPSDPTLHESYVRDAVLYVELAEERNGPIPRPVTHAYVWGDALDDLDRARPDLRIINLETSITRSDDYWPGKGVHYRMHPDNIRCLQVARIDCCTLANNHVLDWGYAGLAETLSSLHSAGLKTAGAGRDAVAAQAPATLPVSGRGRVLVFSYAVTDSGVPATWAAGSRKAGVNLFRICPGLSPLR